MSSEVKGERLREILAAHLCDEFDEDFQPRRSASWPEDENDDGKRNGGYVAIQPKHVQARAREAADRILTVLALRPQREDAGAGGGVVWRGKDIPLECPFPPLGAAGAPNAYEVDPGAGSAMDRVQREWPAPSVVENLRLRDGRVTPLYAAPQPSAPEGWVLVPVTPTHLMLDTGDAHMPQFKAFRGEPILSGYDVCRDVWAGMLSASPSPPTGRDATEEGLVPFGEVHSRAITAVKSLNDWCHVNEAEWTGWGDGDVPAGAEWWRVKSGQALKALEEIQPAAPKPETAQKGDRS